VRRTQLAIIVSIVVWSVASTSGALLAQTSEEYVVVAAYPHDDEAFTQGLDFRRGRFYEGTGLEGRSSLRLVDLETGDVRRQKDLADEYFGEGVTVLGKRIYQLTWQENVAFVYNRETFKRLGRFNYDGEGWGLTHNGRRLIMSNGSDQIVTRDPTSFAVIRSISVRENGESVSGLNELEWINGEIFANIFPTDDVVRIDPKTGEVIDRFNLRALREAEESMGDPNVTNGIAYLSSEDRLFVTGKLWAHVYEIRLTE
jgi:glutaminyl-peptide cyclotransferase